jgi:outer membrane receptor protein involved in Fe transport
MVLTFWKKIAKPEIMHPGWGLRTRVGADWKILKGLSLSNDFMYEKTTSDSRNLMPEKGYDVRSLVNRLTSTDANGKLVFNIPKGDVLDFRNAAYSNYALRNQFNYTNTFKEKHYLNIIAGFDLRKSVNQGNKNRRLGYNDELLTGQSIDAKFLAAQGIIWWNGDRNKYDPASYEGFEFRDTREYSFYSTLAYTYDDRYTLSGSYRTDHSNLFGADPKFRKTPLWSVGGSWNISNEHFFHSNIESISNLRLRGSYGLTGNFDRSNSTTTFLVATRFFNTIANDYVARLQTPPNPKLRWERSETFNLGADIGLLNNRFSLSLDYYRKFSYDLLGSQDLDPTVGLTTATINAASMINRGIEMNLKADVFSAGNFKWNSSFNLAYNKNEITENNLIESSASISRTSGRDIFLKGYERESVWSYKWAGLDNTGRPQTYDANGNKIYIPNIGSLEYSGTYRPKVSGGWTNSFSYKGFEAMIFLAFNYGHVTRREMPNMYGYDWSGSYNDQIANQMAQNLGR